MVLNKSKLCVCKARAECWFTNYHLLFAQTGINKHRYSDKIQSWILSKPCWYTLIPHRSYLLAFLKVFKHLILQPSLTPCLFSNLILSDRNSCSGSSWLCSEGISAHGCPWDVQCLHQAHWGILVILSIYLMLSALGIKPDLFTPLIQEPYFSATYL